MAARLLTSYSRSTVSSNIAGRAADDEQEGPKGIAYPQLALGTLAWIRRGAEADMLARASRVWAYPFWPKVILATFAMSVNQAHVGISNTAD
jgi:hypothetical protein